MSTSTVQPAPTRYRDAPSLADELAGRIAARLGAALEVRGQASLIVSGGRSPVALFERLRTRDLEWGKVSIALADERWVPPTDGDSNERMVRNELLRERAGAATFIGLKNGAPTPESGAPAAWLGIAGMPRPFDVVLLGMGDDGHTASLFPGSPELARALDTTAPAGCIGMRAPSPPQARLSLNLAALLDSRQIIILITGDSKWRTYEQASGSGPTAQMPVRAVLRQTRTPVDVVWSP